jgi:hypothetical protein
LEDPDQKLETPYRTLIPGVNKFIKLFSQVTDERAK